MNLLPTFSLRTLSLISSVVIFKIASIKEKSGWITDAIKKYSGSILNANTDKFRDYLKILSAVAPKVKKEEPTTQNNNNQNNNQNNATNNEQNNK